MPDTRTVLWVTAAQLVAGPGTGWPQRFATAAARAVEQGIPGATTISTSHLHSLASGHRSVTPELECLLLAVGPSAVNQLRVEADHLEQLLDGMRAGLESEDDR
jgi:hypothetical protein